MGEGDVVIGGEKSDQANNAADEGLQQGFAVKPQVPPGRRGIQTLKVFIHPKQSIPIRQSPSWYRRTPKPMPGAAPSKMQALLAGRGPNRCGGHISTDEVFGSLSETGRFCETAPCDPRSPYSASKAASAHQLQQQPRPLAMPREADSGSFKGQLVIPARLRQLLGLQVGDRLALSLEDPAKTSSARSWIGCS